jgi:hypothetical protein
MHGSAMAAGTAAARQRTVAAVNTGIDNFMIIPPKLIIIKKKEKIDIFFD